MTDEKPEKEEEVTPKGAVEVNEEDLDQAAGGVESWSQPADTSVKIDFSAQKAAPADPSIGLLTPQDLAGAGPGAGPHVAPEKKG